MTTATRAAVDLAEEAFYERAVSDSDLRRALCHQSEDERIVLGRPEDVFDIDQPTQSHFPLLGYFGATGPEWGGGFGSVLIQCDVFVWPEGEAGGIERLAEIDALLLGLFHQQAWTYRDRRFMCRQTNWRRGGSDLTLHRIREFRVGIGGES